MSIRGWWNARKAKSERTQMSVDINEDEDAISLMAPEVAGMGFVRGGAFVLKALDEFNQGCTHEQSLELAARLIASQESWQSEGLTMPYWGSLVVLRKLQSEIASIGN